MFVGRDLGDCEISVRWGSGSRLWVSFKVKVKLRTNWHRVSDLVFSILGGCLISVRWAMALGVNSSETGKGEPREKLTLRFIELMWTNLFGTTCQGSDSKLRI